MNVLIVTPMQEELDSLLRSCLLLGYQAEHSAIGRLAVAKLRGLGVTLACGGTGKAQFALQTQYLLDGCPDWDVVICAGAAGALDDGLSVGDIVVATATIEHDYKNRFNDNPVPTFSGAAAIVAELQRAWRPSDSFRVCFGTVASGDEDVVEDDRRDSLGHATGALVVAWEGAGGARACKFSNVPFVEIRGVTDVANGDAPVDFELHLETAMDHIAIVITAWLEAVAKSAETDPDARG